MERPLRGESGFYRSHLIQGSGTYSNRLLMTRDHGRVVTVLQDVKTQKPPLNYVRFAAFYLLPLSSQFEGLWFITNIQGLQILLGLVVLTSLYYNIKAPGHRY